MQDSKKQNQTWEMLIQFREKNPINLKELEKEFDLNKLGLKKITHYEIRTKRILFKQRNGGCGNQIVDSWMENQYRIFMWFLITYCNFYSLSPLSLSVQNWTQISQIFRKTYYFCQYSFHCSRKIKNDPWTTQQDQIIVELMKSQLNKKWTCIGFELFKKTQGRHLKKPKAIRQRWLSHLNPEIKRDDWNAEQQLELIENIRENGKKWSKISNILQHRSEHTIKNRYNKLVLRIKKKIGAVFDEYAQQQILNLVYREAYKKNEQHNRKLKQSNACKMDKVPNLATASTIQQIKAEPDLMVNMQFSNAYIFHPTIIIFAGHNDIYN